MPLAPEIQSFVTRESTPQFLVFGGSQDDVAHEHVVAARLEGAHLDCHVDIPVDLLSERRPFGSTDRVTYIPERHSRKFCKGPAMTQVDVSCGFLGRASAGSADAHFVTCIARQRFKAHCGRRWPGAKVERSIARHIVEASDQEPLEPSRSIDLTEGLLEHVHRWSTWAVSVLRHT